MWNREEMRGKADQVKGAVTEGVGNFKKDQQLREEREADTAKGRAEDAYGKNRRVVGEAIADLDDKLGH